MWRICGDHCVPQISPSPAPARFKSLSDKDGLEGLRSSKIVFFGVMWAALPPT